MKKVLFSITLLSVSLMLTGCFGHCGDFNCTYLNPRWKKAVDTCTTQNRTLILREVGNQLGYKSITEVAFSDIGQHISYQCNRNDGRYDIRRDKQYGHLFAK